MKPAKIFGLFIGGNIRVRLCTSSGQVNYCTQLCFCVFSLKQPPLVFFFSPSQSSQSIILPPPALPFLYNQPRLHKTAETAVFKRDSLLCAETVGVVGWASQSLHCQWPSQECILSVGLGHSQPCGLPMSLRR